MEVLSAMASLKHDHPTWCFPEVVHDEAPIIKTEGLGHPLIHPVECVTNDITIGPPGNFILVTGSNMSGKSILLKSLGLNIILAQAGGPVFAKKMTLQPIILGTSFRIQDSLEQGVSFFMAELKRIKKIIDLAEAYCNAEYTLVFLLDEILLGTNIIERQIAVQAAISHLLDNNAMGMISTHDLSLADVEIFKNKRKAVHFTEKFSNKAKGIELSFDYKLQTGVSKSVNALKLLEIVGIKDLKLPKNKK